jgi:hypothetical protein
MTGAFSIGYGGADDDEVINDRIEQLADWLHQAAPEYRWWLKRRLVFVDKDDAVVDVPEEEGLLYSGIGLEIRDTVFIYAQQNRMVNKSTYRDETPKLACHYFSSIDLLDDEAPQSGPDALAARIISYVKDFYRPAAPLLSWSDLLR